MVKSIPTRTTISIERFDDKDYDLLNALDRADEKKQDQAQIHRASKIIICVSNGVNTLSDIANYCRLSKSTTHRLLKALEESHFVIYNTFSRQYLIGELITDMAARPEIYHDYLKICAIKEMEKLADITEETVTLSMMIGLRQVKMLSVPSKHDLRVVEGSQKAGTYFSGAMSHVLLSQLKDSELKAALKHLQIEKLTSNTIVDKDVLLALIRRIRQQGYAVSTGERLVGAMCVSAPVRNYMLPTALSILGPLSRMENNTASLIDLLITVSDRISFNILEIFKPKA